MCMKGSFVKRKLLADKFGSLKKRYLYHSKCSCYAYKTSHKYDRKYEFTNMIKLFVTEVNHCNFFLLSSCHSSPNCPDDKIPIDEFENKYCNY